MSKHRLPILGLLTLASIGLSACAAGEQKQAADAAVAQVQTATGQKPGAKPAAKAAQPVEDERAPALSVPQGYRYETQGRRDPFVNPVPKKSEDKTAGGDSPKPPEIKPPDGLPGIQVAQAKVTGIVYSSEPGMTRVFLQTPRKTYLAARGDVLFDAVIKEIRSSEVVFTMVSPVDRKPTNREIVVRPGGISAGEKQ